MRMVVYYVSLFHNHNCLLTSFNIISLLALSLSHFFSLSFSHNMSSCYFVSWFSHIKHWWKMRAKRAREFSAHYSGLCWENRKNPVSVWVRTVLSELCQMKLNQMNNYYSKRFNVNIFLIEDLNVLLSVSQRD